jgi:hypothetical protein
MKLTKIEEEITSARIEKEITLELNDKEVIVRYYSYSSRDDIDDSNWEIIEDEGQYDELTDEEKDFLDDYILEMIRNDVGHLVETN